jgi:hypothetical protein
MRFSEKCVRWPVTENATAGRMLKRAIDLTEPGQPQKRVA